MTAIGIGHTRASRLVTMKGRRLCVRLGGLSEQGLWAKGWTPMPSDNAVTGKVP
jgi:hypothetical protein